MSDIKVAGFSVAFCWNAEPPTGRWFPSFEQFRTTDRKMILSHQQLG
jgi:hypothetical protein